MSPYHISPEDWNRALEKLPAAQSFTAETLYQFLSQDVRQSLLDKKDGDQEQALNYVRDRLRQYRPQRGTIFIIMGPVQADEIYFILHQPPGALPSVNTQEGETLSITVVPSQQTQPSNNEKQEHQVEAGMVEVSLATASVVTGVATLAQAHLSRAASFLLFFLVLITGFTALWFLARYCRQQGIIKPRKDWHAIPTLIIDPGAEMYWFLSFSLIFLIVVFIVVLTGN